MSDWKVGDRVDVFGDKGVLVGLATPLNGKERWLVRWDSDGFPHRGHDQQPPSRKS